ncbi:thioredoxin domain-containing protein [Sphingomonas immobilis]|uniref:Thioredoxin domain-containing protein n=1 Tax=Sphingomonas immobilis TaxID=3063997 RepID=A0ABT8ZZS0_9SPHN|nr:thioredoxin domain-containing protein [Sphingomonas sp. CA1-15]MDO7843071.1 thioredoxin domain-containing protein [Sphingomonas sp. CA1-15]
MKVRFAVAIVAALVLGACKPSGNGSGGATSAPVAAVKAPAGQDWTETVATTPEGGYRMGNPNAPIKLIEYGSRTCPVCGLFGREGFEPLKNKYVSTGKVSFEFREYLVHGQPDFPAALLGRCGGTGPFFAILEQMYQEQQPVEEKMTNAEGQALFQKLQGAKGTDVAKAWADHLGYVDFVKQRGIPEAKARACLNDQKDLDAIFKIMAEGDKKGVTGTPSFFINDEKNSAVSWEQLEPALKAAGA